MKKQFGVGFIPYEPGDLVKLKEGRTVYRIEDIMMKQAIVAKTVEFEVLLSLGGNEYGWFPAGYIDKRIIQK